MITPDAAPGFYYVSIRRGASKSECRLLLGPFENDHAAALARVEKAREIALAMCPHAAFCAFGTLRSEMDIGPGIFNRLGFAVDLDQ
jgi:hypothetical protein